MEDALTSAKAKLEKLAAMFTVGSGPGALVAGAIEDIDTHIALAPWLRKPMPVEVLPPLSLDADESERKSRKVPTPKPSIASINLDF